MQVLATPLETTDDALYRGQVRLRQPKNGYRFGSDAALLAACVTGESGQKVLDLGCGVGAVLLGAAYRLQQVAFTGIEREAEYALLAQYNATANNMAHRVTVIQDDVRSKQSAPLFGTFDHVVANPPYFGQDTHTAAPQKLRAVARQETDATIADWLQAANVFLRPQGTLTMIYPMDRLSQWLYEASRFAGGITIFPLWPKTGRQAKRVVLRATKGSNAPTALAPGLIVHREDGSYTDEADAVINQGRYLNLGL